jgi:hypothetical protein
LAGARRKSLLMMELTECTLMNIKMSAMESYIKDSGTRRREIEMELVFNSGLMAPNMKVCGDKIKQTEKVA